MESDGGNTVLERFLRLHVYFCLAGLVSPRRSGGYLDKEGGLHWHGWLSGHDAENCKIPDNRNNQNRFTKSNVFEALGGSGTGAGQSHDESFELKSFGEFTASLEAGIEFQKPVVDLFQAGHAEMI